MAVLEKVAFLGLFDNPNFAHVMRKGECVVVLNAQDEHSSTTTNIRSIARSVMHKYEILPEKLNLYVLFADYSIALIPITFVEPERIMETALIIENPVDIDVFEGQYFPIEEAILLGKRNYHMTEKAFLLEKRRREQEIAERREMLYNARMLSEN